MTSAALDDVVASLGTVSLDVTNEAASLQTRVDRKYVVDASVLGRVLATGDVALDVLAIDGIRRFAYESVYFDTPRLDLLRAAALQRPRQVKVRTRLYVDTGLSVLEVKTKSVRGVTRKERVDHPVEGRRALTPTSRAFVDARAVLPEGSHGLRPVLTTLYRRATLLDRADGVRVTIDDDLRCVGIDDRVLRLHDGDVVVETKTSGPPSTIDRALWRAGHRPVSISKFGVGLAGLDPSLPAARWRRTIRRHFDLVA